MEAHTPKMQEPMADYASDAKMATAASTTTTTTTTATQQKSSTSIVAQVARVDEEGQKFDENDIRIGRWEMEPCGEHCSNVLVALFLPCVSIAQISHRMGGSYTTMLVFSGFVYIAANLAWSQSFEDYEYYYNNLDGSIEKRMPWTARRSLCTALSTLLGLVWVVMIVTLRSGIRDRFQIPGGCCGDCCCAIWCSCCVLTQMATHIKSYKPGSCDFGPAVDQLPAYSTDGAVGERV
ncbi:hypothetical protein ATCC90586_002986 [Pythium insidiosum]|nr:hypothetical protein ATCC90586_002986 [Pythium insidiosum]